MKPKNIFLVRHGQSEGNVDKLVYGTKPDYAISLTEKGHGQALTCGLKLREYKDDCFFFVSSYYRTIQTFEDIKLGMGYRPDENVPVYQDDRLREQEWTGKLRTKKQIEQLLSTEKERDEYGHYFYRFENGESCADVELRICSFFDTLFRMFEKPVFPNNVIIVTHGMTLRVFIKRFFHLTVPEFEMLRNPKNASITQLIYNDFTHKYQLKEPMVKYDKPTNIYHPYVIGEE